MNDLDDITPPEGVPIPSAEEQARSERAEVRPGTHVRPPETIVDRWERNDGIDAIIERARDHIQKCAYPTREAPWPTIRRWLIEAREELADATGDDSWRKYLTVCALLRGDRNA